MKKHSIPRLALALAALTAGNCWAAATALNVTTSVAPYAGTTNTAQSNGSIDVSAQSAADEVEYSNGTSSAFATTQGAYHLNGYATGKYSQGAPLSSTADTALSFSFTNDTGFAQAFNLKFKVLGGSLDALLRDGTTALSDTESVAASYDAMIKVNGVSRFESHAVLGRDQSGLSLNQSGVSLSSDDGSDGRFSWGIYSQVIDLGILAAGQSVTIDASMFLSASSQTEWADNIHDVEDFSCDGTVFRGCGRATIGDPFAINTFVFEPAAQGGGNVPEPGTLMLAGLGMVTALLRRRKR